MTLTKIEADAVYAQTPTYYISKFASKIWEYIPNLQEASTTSAVQAAVNTILAGALSFKNVAAGNIVRDAAKTPSVIVNSWEKIQIGHSNNTYDEGTESAQYLKLTCKTSLVATAYYFDAQHVESASRSANFICEVPNRIMYIAAMDRQNTNMTDTSYTSYLFENYDNEWLAKSIIGGLPKVLVMDSVGQFIGSWGIANKVKYVVTKAVADTVGLVLPSFKTTVLSAVSAAQVGPSENTISINAMKFPGIKEFYKHLKLENTDPTLIKLSKISLIPGLIGLDFVSKFSGELVSTYIFTPIARVVLDLGVKVTEFLSDEYDELFVQADTNKIDTSKALINIPQSPSLDINQDLQGLDNSEFTDEL